MQTTEKMPDQPQLQAPVQEPPAKPRSSTPLHSTDLLNGRKSVSIEHQGKIYRLQTTKLGKLILTK